VIWTVVFGGVIRGRGAGVVEVVGVERDPAFESDPGFDGLFETPGDVGGALPSFGFACESVFAPALACAPPVEEPEFLGLAKLGRFGFGPVFAFGVVAAPACVPAVGDDVGECGF
jgi:hypothetical protein